MEDQNSGRHGFAPWVWILIVLAAIILIFVIWWAVAAQSPNQTVVVPGEQQQPSTTPPTIIPPSQPSQPSNGKPVVVQPQQPVNIYIGKEQPKPNVVIVPRGKEIPQATDNMKQVNLPGSFKYTGSTWNASTEAVSGDSTTMTDVGVQVQGHEIYVPAGDTKPYTELYIETSSGSNIYLKYTPRNDGGKG